MRTSPHVSGALLCLLVGCAGGSTEEPPGSTGGTPGSGGTATGGSTHTGGSPGSGGISTPGTGGQSSTGGSTGSGGISTPGTGGQSSTGGSTGTGGTSTGGTVSATGGQAIGGRGGRGGSASTATGGSGAAGRGAGGRATGGSAPGTGGSASGSGGSGPITSTCTEADKSVSNNGTGKHCGFTYEYWKDSGNGTLTLTKDGLNVNWSSVNDLLGRKGIRPGSADLVVNYTADYQPNGNSYLCIYGWTRNPLVEYYIVDSWGNWRPPGGQGKVGMVTSDGGTYETYKIARNGANIDGNGAFTQYWSVRTSKINSGTITVGNHFNAWKNSGMPMGSLYEVSMTVEGYQSSGKADVKFTMK